MKIVCSLLAACALCFNVSAIVVDGVVDAAYGAPIASDPSGDGNGNAPMDLLELYAAADTSNLYVAFSINTDIVSTDWGKYLVYIDTDVIDNSGATSDAWGRNVVVENTGHLPEYSVNCWVDSPPFGSDHFQVVHWTGSEWDWGTVAQPVAAALAGGTTSVIEWALSWNQLGNPAGTIYLEAWSTGGGGGDNAQDTINDPADDWNATDWSTQATLQNSTPFIVPEPASAAIILIGTMAVLLRKQN